MDKLKDNITLDELTAICTELASKPIIPNEKVTVGQMLEAYKVWKSIIDQKDTYKTI